MKIKDSLLSTESWKKMFKKLFICIIIIVTILTSIGIFIFKDFGLGYKYYKIETSQSMYVGSTMENNFLSKTIDEHIKYLTDEGYYITSYALNKSFIETKAIIPKSTTTENDIKKEIISHLDITILCTKLNIKDDEKTYYFKTQTECDEFVNSLNSYIKQEISSDGSAENYKVITSKEVLESKINEVKTQKEKNDAEAEAAKRAAEEKARLAKQRQQQTQVTSRGGTTSRTTQSTYSGGAPLASYVYISSNYGSRHGKMHTGVDFAAPAGTSIYAWKSGKVTFAGWSGNYGNFIIVEHNDGTVSRYAHCSKIAVSAGQAVSKGQTIGYVGTTGNSTGNHLHFEIKINGSFVNPLNYL
mgnify:CR=1 FL=1